MLVTALTMTALLLGREAALALFLASIGGVIALSSVAVVVAVVLSVGAAIRGARSTAPRGVRVGRSGRGPRVRGAGVRGSRVSEAAVRRALVQAAQDDPRGSFAEPPRVDIDDVIAAMELAFVDREISAAGRRA